MSESSYRNDSLPLFPEKLIRDGPFIQKNGFRWRLRHTFKRKGTRMIESLIANNTDARNGAALIMAFSKAHKSLI
ncbi:hypothetical protein [Cernens ardua]|uniref:hypothetical protein n=1 Tax=Cernens ardua TaxID=3402176 RepID=UPI003F9C3C3E